MGILDLGTYAPGSIQLTQDQQQKASTMGWLNAAAALANASASHPVSQGGQPSVMQLLTTGLGGYAQGAQQYTQDAQQAKDYGVRSQMQDMQLQRMQQDNDYQRQLSSFFSNNPEAVQSMGVPQGMPVSPTMLADFYKTKAETAAKETPEEAALKKAQAAYYNSKASGQLTPEQGGQVWFLAQKLKADNPALTDTQAIQLAQTGFRQGIQLDADGKAIATPGYAGAKADIAGTTAQATQTGKNAADAQNALPNTEAQAHLMLKAISDLENAKGMNAIYGMAGQIPNMPGSRASDAQAKLNQIKGQEFMTAYNSLRGGGNISDAEGKKAEVAISTLGDQKQSPEAARQALKDLRDVVNQGIENARKKANAGYTTTGNNGGKQDPLGLR